MLVLSRRDGEQIVVGDNVVITVLSIVGGRVRIGIDAPKSVQIRRSELQEKTPSPSVHWMHLGNPGVAEFAATVS